MQTDIVRFVPSNPKVIEEVLKLAEIKAWRDVFYELGSGDGRGVVRSVQAPFYARRAVGFEIKPFLAEIASESVKKLNLQDKVAIRNKDFSQSNLSEADVVFMYIGELPTEKVRPKLEDELKPESRVVSHYYDVKGWRPSKIIDVVAPRADTGPLTHRTLYMYRMNEIY
jgi:tRNA A58 N-methylase Trm61